MKAGAAANKHTKGQDERRNASETGREEPTEQRKERQRELASGGSRGRRIRLGPGERTGAGTQAHMRGKQSRRHSQSKTERHLPRGHSKGRARAKAQRSHTPEGEDRGKWNPQKRGAPGNNMGEGMTQHREGDHNQVRRAGSESGTKGGGKEEEKTKGRVEQRPKKLGQRKRGQAGNQ